MWKKAVSMGKGNLGKMGILLLAKKLFVFALLLTISTGQSCDAGFTETLNIKVIDSQYRPIEGASVIVNYQKDRTTNKGFVNSTTQYTGENGSVSVTIRNTEAFQNRVDCTVTIYAEYDGVIVQRKIEAQKHSAELQVQFSNAYLLYLRVVDRYGAPIANTQVRINDMYRNTSGEGYAPVIVNEGTVDVAVPYLEGVISEQIDITQDLTYTLQARVYSFRLSVVDDAGRPLDAQIFVEGDEYYGSEVEISEIALANPEVKAVYGTLEKSPAVDLSQESEYKVSFDLTPPQISDIEVVERNDELRIMFFLTDPNTLSSGPDLDETTVTYTVGGVTETAVPYAYSGAYAADIPKPPENTILRFTITTHDMEGNMNSLNGEYLITPEEEEPVPQVQEPEEVLEEEEEGDGTIPMIVGSFVILLLAYVVYSYFRGISEGK